MLAGQSHEQDIQNRWKHSLTRIQDALPRVEIGSHAHQLAELSAAAAQHIQEQIDAIYWVLQDIGLDMGPQVPLELAPQDVQDMQYQTPRKMRQPIEPQEMIHLDTPVNTRDEPSRMESPTLELSDMTNAILGTDISINPSSQSATRHSIESTQSLTPTNLGTSSRSMQLLSMVLAEIQDLTAELIFQTDNRDARFTLDQLQDSSGLGIFILTKDSSDLREYLESLVEMGKLGVADNTYKLV